MVINKINKQTIKPLVYKIGTKSNVVLEEKASPEPVNKKDVEKLRTAVLQAITRGEEQERLAKKSVKKNIWPGWHFTAKAKPVSCRLSGLKQGWGYFWRAGLVALIFFIVVNTIGMYLAGWQNGTATLVARALPLPAVFINGRFLLLRDFFNDVKAMENYFSRNNLPGQNNEIRPLAIKKMVEKEILTQLAESGGQTVSPAEIDNELQTSALNQTTPAELNQLVKELYGWDFSTYVSKVIKPLILAKKVENDFNQTSGNQAVKDKMSEILNKISSQEVEFGELATLVNEDETKNTAGDWGWFKMGEAAPAIEFAMLSLDAGSISDIIETDDGFHIVKLEERLTDSQTNQPYFHASHIFVKKKSFQQYLDEQIKKATIVTLIKI